MYVPNATITRLAAVTLAVPLILTASAPAAAQGCEPAIDPTLGWVEDCLPVGGLVNPHHVIPADTESDARGPPAAAAAGFAG